MRHRSVRIALPALVLALALLVGGGLYARSGVLDRSTASTAPSGPVTGLTVSAADGSLLEARGGLFRSTDQGRTWRALSLPAALHPTALRQVATTPAAPASIYAAGPGAGVVRSADAGKTWRRIGQGLPSQDVAAFAVHSFRPDTLYAWIAGQGVFRTENGGTTWQKMDAGPPAAVVALAHSTLPGSMNTGWLYAATPQGPYLSMDCF